MEKFQGWTPVTIENLTFDQLEAIFWELSKRHGGGGNREVNLSNVPNIKMTEKEKNAWLNAGMPSPVEKFIREQRNAS